MPEMIRRLVLIALLSCGRGSQPPPAPPAPPAPAASPAPPAPPPTADAASTSPPPDASLYKNGHPLASGDDDRYACRASDDLLRTCTGACRLMPPVAYWDAPMRCSGVARPPPSLLEEKKRLAALAIPPCQCTCDAGYRAASDARRQQQLDCARVP